ncbi:MAG: sulfite exporter TauE/SafE family protein [Gammaproteobacteria bacterium]
MLKTSVTNNETDYLLTLVSDEAFQWALLATVLAGLARGFSGFGAGMLFTPIVSLAYEPKFAIALLFLIDFIVAIPLLPGAIREYHIREVLPICLGATVTVPIGIYFLSSGDPIVLRYLISIIILIFVALLASGWRYRKSVSSLGLFGLGNLSGFLGGISTLYGPPILLFWMSRNTQSKTIRANIIIFFAYISIVAGTGLWVSNLLTREAIVLAITLLPVYALVVWIGAQFFQFSSERFFRNLVYSLIGLVAITSLPVWG